MAGYDNYRTRATESVEGHDPHAPLGPPEFREVLEADQARAAERERAQTGAGAELSAQAEIMQDQILIEMARAQTTALRTAVETAEPSMVGKSDEEIIAYFNDLQLSDPNRALDIMNESIAGAAAILDQAGVTSTSLASAINRAGQSVGQNFNGTVQDLGKMDTTGILTIAGVGFGSFIVTGRPGVGIVMGGLATAIQSPHLTDMTINIASGVVRGGTQLAALPVRGSMRTVDVLNNLGQPGLVESIQNNVAGLSNDVIHSIAYTFDGEYTPENGTENNLLLREFLEQGEVFAPRELQPLILYLKELRNGGPISHLPTQAELNTAGSFIAQVEDLVTPDQFIAIDQRRRAGETLTDRENQMYILGKYCLLINQSFIGENALQPQATLVRAAYEAENGVMSLEQAFGSLSAAELAQLNEANFSWSPEQITAFDHNVEGLPINFQTLTSNGGFVGLALTAYLALTYGLMMLKGAKGAYNAAIGRPLERGRVNRRLALDDRPLSNPERTRLRNSLSARTNTVGPVVTALTGASVLATSSEFDQSIRDSNLESFGQTEYNTLLSLSEDNNATREQVRDAFFDLMHSGTLDDQQERNMNARRDYYTYLDALNRIDNFYRYDPRGRAREIRLGGETYTIGRPERADFTFTTVNQLLQISNPRNFYRYMTNSGDGRALRMRGPNNREIYLKIRRNNSGVFEFNALDEAGWQSFDLNEFANSVRNSSGEGGAEGTTS